VKIARPAARPPRIEMIPLIDTFFLLLAFFISAVFTMESVAGLPVRLPGVSAAEPVPKIARRLVTLTAEGRIQLDGAELDLGRLERRLREAAASQAVRVGIRADAAAPYQQVVSVLEAVRRAGVREVALLTRTDDEAPNR